MRAVEEVGRGARARVTSPATHVVDWTTSDAGAASRGPTCPTNTPSTSGIVGGQSLSGQARRQSSHDSPDSPQAPPEARELHFKVLLLFPDTKYIYT